MRRHHRGRVSLACSSVITYRARGMLYPIHLEPKKKHAILPFGYRLLVIIDSFAYWTDPRASQQQLH